MPHVTVDGLEFHVQRLGRARPDADPVIPVTPVVMLHGLFTGSVASWYFTCAPALARQRPVVLYDLRGHGRSSRPTSGYSSTSQAGDLDRLTAELPPFALVAHSFGALVAMRFARRHPERVAALALVEPPIPPDGRRAWWTEHGRGPAGDPDAFDPEQWLATTDADPTERRAQAVRQRQLDHITTLTRQTTLLADLRSEPDLTDDDLAALPVPLLAVFGRRSACAEALPRLRRVRPDATIAVLDAGHAVHVDATGELTTLLEKCLGEARAVEPADPGPVCAPDQAHDDAPDADDVAYG